jgi:hypothetical protein
MGREIEQAWHAAGLPVSSGPDDHDYGVIVNGS